MTRENESAITAYDCVRVISLFVNDIGSKFSGESQ